MPPDGRVTRQTAHLFAPRRLTCRPTAYSNPPDGSAVGRPTACWPVGRHIKRRRRLPKRRLAVELSRRRVPQTPFGGRTKPSDGLATRSKRCRLTPKRRRVAQKARPTGGGRPSDGRLKFPHAVGMIVERPLDGGWHKRSATAQNGTFGAVRCLCPPCTLRHVNLLPVCSSGLDELFATCCCRRSARLDSRPLPSHTHMPYATATWKNEQSAGWNCGTAQLSPNITRPHTQTRTRPEHAVITAPPRPNSLCTH